MRQERLMLVTPKKDTEPENFTCKSSEKRKNLPNSPFSKAAYSALSVAAYILLYRNYQAWQLRICRIPHGYGCKFKYFSANVSSSTLSVMPSKVYSNFHNYSPSVVTAVFFFLLLRSSLKNVVSISEHSSSHTPLVISHW